MTCATRASNAPDIRIAISRGRAIERAVLRILPAAIILAGSIGTISSLNFTPNPLTNRITEYCLTVVLFPVGLAGGVLAFNGTRWLLTALWPGRLYVVADAGGITVCAGPMGTTRYSLDRLRVRYPFELHDEENDDDALYESLLEPSEQMATLLPRIEYQGHPVRIDRRVLHFTGLNEAQAVERLRPFIEFARA